MKIKEVAVVGAGLMGIQIALNAALHGYSVSVCDTFPSALEKAQTWVDTYLAGRVSKGKLSEAQAAEGKANLSYWGNTAEGCKKEIWRSSIS